MRTLLRLDWCLASHRSQRIASVVSCLQVRQGRVMGGMGCGWVLVWLVLWFGWGGDGGGGGGSRGWYPNLGGLVWVGVGIVVLV